MLLHIFYDLINDFVKNFNAWHIVITSKHACVFQWEFVTGRLNNLQLGDLCNDHVMHSNLSLNWSVYVLGRSLL